MAIDEGLDRIEAQLQEEGQRVIAAIRGAVRALEDRDVELADEVIAFDDEIDRLFLEIESKIQSLLALQTPVARDLRLVLAILHINLLRAYARVRGVRLIGDVPIYVSDVGADVAAWPELFAKGEVAGAPPDALSANGQHWGNPLYDWHVHRATGYRWWIERFRRAFELVDLSRVDHFRGFVSYWAIPERNKTARQGTWKRGPGAELFHAVEGALGALPLIAEDLGVITEPVRRLRDELGLPGMVVLLWAFRNRPHNPHALQNHRENQVVYTTTHDTDTAVGWYASLTQRERKATGLDPNEPNWGLIELASSSPAALAIVPAQDVVGLGSEARMNRPGEVEGNWSWRLKPGDLTPALAARLREVTERGHRTLTTA